MAAMVQYDIPIACPMPSVIPGTTTRDTKDQRDGTRGVCQMPSLSSSADETLSLLSCFEFLALLVLSSSPPDASSTVVHTSTPGVREGDTAVTRCDIIPVISTWKCDIDTIPTKAHPQNRIINVGIQQFKKVMPNPLMSPRSN